MTDGEDGNNGSERGRTCRRRIFGMDGMMGWTLGRISVAKKKREGEAQKDAGRRSEKTLPPLRRSGLGFCSKFFCAYYILLAPSFRLSSPPHSQFPVFGHGVFSTHRSVSSDDGIPIVCGTLAEGYVGVFNATSLSFAPPAAFVPCIVISCSLSVFFPSTSQYPLRHSTSVSPRQVR